MNNSLQLTVSLILLAMLLSCQKNQVKMKPNNGDSLVYHAYMGALRKAISNRFTTHQYDTTLEKIDTYLKVHNKTGFFPITNEEDSLSYALLDTLCNGRSNLYDKYKRLVKLRSLPISNVGFSEDLTRSISSLWLEPDKELIRVVAEMPDSARRDFIDHTTSWLEDNDVIVIKSEVFSTAMRNGDYGIVAKNIKFKLKIRKGNDLFPRSP